MGGHGSETIHDDETIVSLPRSIVVGFVTNGCATRAIRPSHGGAAQMTL